MIDTHAHLDFKQFNKDREKVISRSFEKGLTKIINIGCNLKRSKSTVALSAKHENIYASVGVHPHDANELVEMDCNPSHENAILGLKKLAQSKKVVAIGEIGLDYYNMSEANITSFAYNAGRPAAKMAGKPNLPSRKTQIKAFKAQFKMAQELGLPVILHVREAHGEMLKIFVVEAIHELPLRGVVHCFSGSWKDAEQYLSLGFYISFTGIITYTDSYDKVIQNTPLERIMLETDCPYLAPVPHRGERCEPWMVKFIAQKIAQVKKIDIEQVAIQTTTNAVKLFGL